MVHISDFVGGISCRGLMRYGNRWAYYNIGNKKM